MDLLPLGFFLGWRDFKYLLVSGTLRRVGKKTVASSPPHHYQWFCTFSPMHFPRFTAASDKNARKNEKGKRIQCKAVSQPSDRGWYWYGAPPGFPKVCLQVTLQSSLKEPTMLIPYVRTPESSREWGQEFCMFNQLFRGLLCMPDCDNHWNCIKLYPNTVPREGWKCKIRDS